MIGVPHGPLLASLTTHITASKRGGNNLQDVQDWNRKAKALAILYVPSWRTLSRSPPLSPGSQEKVKKKGPVRFPPKTVASVTSEVTGASKSLYQSRPQTVAFFKGTNRGRRNHRRSTDVCEGLRVTFEGERCVISSRITFQEVGG